MDRDALSSMLGTGILVCAALVACEPASPPSSDTPTKAAPPTVEPPPPEPATPAPPPHPTAPHLAPTHARVSATVDHTCAIVRRGSDPTHRVKCWGNNTYGELGTADREPRTAADKGMGDALPFVELPGVTELVSIGTGSGRSCVLERGGALWCWGEGGEQGAPETSPPAPAKVPLPGPVVAFSIGRAHTCAVLDDQSLRCWGRTPLGPLGVPHPVAPSKTLAAIDLGDGVQAVDVTAGSEHNCVLLTSGRVKCFGDGMMGQLGIADTQSRGIAPDQLGDALPFAQLGDDFTAASITAGGLHTCASSTSGEVTCWGGNRVGQLGQGHTDSPGRKPGQSPAAAPPPPRTELGSEGTVVALRAGNSHTCALVERSAEDNGIKCWGSHPRGARGDDPGEMGDALPFVDLGADRQPIEIAAGGHTCAVVIRESAPQDGRLLCWGNDEPATGIDVGRFAFESPKSMGDALPYVDLGTDVFVVVAPRDRQSKTTPAAASSVTK